MRGYCNPLASAHDTTVSARGSFVISDGLPEVLRGVETGTELVCAHGGRSATSPARTAPAGGARCAALCPSHAMTLRAVCAAHPSRL